ncbi:hypothetical protein F8388_011244 [Cannabis sativa]|uniref:USP domain-containing protein n=1 Tax=Cannabis sativa TaxID=3483 RepID=A0A7J6FAE7_CANSA|nr:hypothetical protein F8388_011244 [Cannabis sativa]
MGNKKRNLAARPKQSPAASPAAVTKQVVDGAAGTADGLSPDELEPTLSPDTPNPVSESKIVSPKSVESDASSEANVRLECDRALMALRRGNHTKALRLTKELCQRYEKSAHLAIVYRVQSTVCSKMASVIEDQNVKYRHLRRAIESARRAVELSPNSIEFGHFYANLMFESANEAKEYEEVVRECERLLAIENPVDPAKESSQEDSQEKLSTPEARIGNVQNEIRQLIQKSNIASISSWMKNLGNGDDKFRLIPIRRMTEDPMEGRLPPARRPNEIKKATKTQEERRKEIEVRVAAARLLQQKSEVPQLEIDGDKTDKGLDSLPASGQRTGDRRKSSNTRKSQSCAENRDFVRSFWNTTSIDKKRDLLKVGILDIKSHFAWLKDGLANDVLLEALSFTETNSGRKWSVRVCCRCNERFADSDSHLHHITKEHVASLLPKLRSMLPEEVNNEWIEMLHKCSWKPVDVSAAVEMVQNQTKCKDSEFVKDCTLGKNMGDSSSEKGNQKDSHCISAAESGIHEKVTNIESGQCPEANGSMAHSSIADSWPVSDDSERAKLLERISALFEVLVRNKCLATSHLKWVTQFAFDELQKMNIGFQLLNNGVMQTPMCICFLGVSELQKILNVLQDLSHSCGLGRNSEKSSIMDEANIGSKCLEIKELLVLSADASFVVLDECLLSDESTHVSSHHDATGKASAGASAVVSNVNDSDLNDTSAFLSWIYAGPTSGEELASWMRVKEEKASEGMEILQMIEKEFYQLQSLCEQKCEHLSYEEALQAVENLCAEENRKRIDSRDYVHQSFDSILKQRREELESDNDGLTLRSRFELDAILNIIKEVEAPNVNEFGYEETYSGLTSQLCDLESGEDYLLRVESCIEASIRRHKEHIQVELSKTDAKLMRNVNIMEQLKLKLGSIAVHDYHSILLPLVKSYLRAHLEKLAQKDATEKSDAAREAFLAELALDDSKKVVRGGNDNSRHTQEKTKDKKKNKESRKAKHSKVTGVSEPRIHDDEIDNPVPLPVACEVAYDADHPTSEVIVSVDGDSLKQQEEELRRRIELEAEERKLEETLEFQRRMENEAKQRHLAEQHKKETYHEKVEEAMHDASLKFDSVDLDASEQSKPSMQEHLASKSEDVLTPHHSTSPTALCTQMSRDNQAKVGQGGLANEGITGDGFLPSERRRRARKQKSSVKVSDGKHQFSSSPRESAEVGSSLTEGGLKEVHSSSIMSAPGDDEAKSLGHLQAEDDFEERFHADIEKAMRQSLGKSAPGDDEAKSLGHLQAEDDFEERFHADMKKAKRQSLDIFEARKKLPSVSTSSKMLQMTSGEVDSGGGVPNDDQVDNVIEDNKVGAGLKNEVGEYNCFLNVIIQSLWHIRRFRDEFLQKTSEHVHIGDPCVVCALYEIFSALNVASIDSWKEAVAPTSLRIALSNLFPDSNFFQEAQMNDASEVLGVIFDCLHRSFTPASSISDTKSVVNSWEGSWDCVRNTCIVHSIFGMNISESMDCYNCGVGSKFLKYTTFFHNINASALRTMKVMCAESSFQELLKFVELNHQSPCDAEAGGCGKLNYINHILSSPPHVFTAVLGWQNTSESVDDIRATLSALNTDIDISAIYRGIGLNNKYSLVSVVCYYGQHYRCYAYSHEHKQWIMYDDKTVKVIGSWVNVLDSCERGHWQPQLLLFEAGTRNFAEPVACVSASV